MQLRDLLKFEFFFEDRDAFPRHACGRELAERDPNWEETLARQRRGRARAGQALAAVSNSHRVLRTVPRGVPRGRGPPPADASGDRDRRARASSTPASGSGASTTSSGASTARSRSRRCCSRRRSSSPTTAASCTRPSPRSKSGGACFAEQIRSSLRRNRRGRGARGEPPRGTDRVGRESEAIPAFIPAFLDRTCCYRRTPWWKPGSITSRSECPTSRPSRRLLASHLGGARARIGSRRRLRVLAVGVSRAGARSR